jgi:23S rRNA-/tRNA-specific pseudouridylate synthase
MFFVAIYTHHRLVLFARTPAAAARFSPHQCCARLRNDVLSVVPLRRYASMLQKDLVSKVYVARVRGHFPPAVEVSAPIYCANREKGIYAVLTHEAVISVPSDTVDNSASMLTVSRSTSASASSRPRDAREARTCFTLLHYDGHTSLIQATPLTGHSSPAMLRML